MDGSVTAEPKVISLKSDCLRGWFFAQVIGRRFRQTATHVRQVAALALPVSSMTTGGDVVEATLPPLATDVHSAPQSARVGNRSS